VIIDTKVHARAGLLGNPSDMYGGKVMSFLIGDFSARVRLWESPRLTFRMHPEHDRVEFEDLADLVTAVDRHGYYGMQRLLLATCRRFADYSARRGIKLRKARFTLEYETNIPRQSGLGGSSAMIIAALRALLRFHHVPARSVRNRDLAELALSVETQELGIAAGLQDRVVQSYGGLTYMDFSGGRAKYTKLSSRWLPQFGIAYLAEQHFGTLESGRVHSEVRYRWEQGDPGVRRRIRAVARCAERGRQALQARNVRLLSRLMDRNFDLRRELFGDEALGAHNLALVDIARRAGLAAKLPGSSGAVLILLGDDAKGNASLAQAYAEQGYHYLPITAI